MSHHTAAVVRGGQCNISLYHDHYNHYITNHYNLIYQLNVTLISMNTIFIHMINKIRKIINAFYDFPL